MQFVVIFLGLTGLVAYAVSKFTSGSLVVVITAVGIVGFVIALVILAFRLGSFGRIVRTVILSFLAVLAGTYLILVAAIYFFQDAIANQTSSFFQPRTMSVEAAQALTAPDVTAVDLPTPGGVHLRGWLVRSTTEARSPLVIYFGGSGSEASAMIPLAQNLTGWSVAVINYRGFGLSEGIPSHANVLADALFIYDTLAARGDIDADRVVTMGYSLGTGVAVHLSEQRPAAGTILVSPYDRWSLVGLKRPPLYTPLSGILTPYFDSISRAPGITTPMLCLIGSADAFVPPELSVRLASAWGGATKVITYPGEDHGLLFHNNSSGADIAAFLHSIESK